MPTQRQLALLAGLLLLAPLAPAQTVVGRVVDSFGNGVGGVDIDVLNEGSGGDPDIFNDGTDPNGFFTMTVVPGGVYDIEFNPPPPPTTTDLTFTLRDVFVFGTVDVGVVVLPPGVALSGRVLDPGGLPVNNVNLDVVDETTGERLVTPADRTDVFGNFSIAVPANDIELRLNTTSVVGQTLAPRALALSPTVDTDLGDLFLEQGFVVSGNLQSTSGAPIATADFDFTDSVTRQRLYTPGDDSDDFGNFSIVVPAGVYDVEVCPQPGDLFVAREFDSLTVATNLSFGALQLTSGFLMSGTVLLSGGAPAGGVDVDVEDAFTGATIALCRDDTDAAGFYSVVVPTGTFTVTFARRCLGEIEKVDVHTSVLVTGNRTLNGLLPAGPCQTTRRGSPGGMRGSTAP